MIQIHSIFDVMFGSFHRSFALEIAHVGTIFNCGHNFSLIIFVVKYVSDSSKCNFYVMLFVSKQNLITKRI